jgi:hypothetical protein
MAGLALTALVGIGLVTIAGGIYTYKSIPVWITKLENKIIEQKHQAALKHIEALKGNAKKNPIEQMELTYQSNAKKIDILTKSITELKAAVSSQKRNVSEHKKKKPNYDSSEEDDQIKKLESLVQFKEYGLSEAKANLELYKEKMETVKFKWEFKNTANKALDEIDRLKDEDIMRNLLTEVAIEEVGKSMDQVMARVDIEMNQVDLNKLDKLNKLDNYQPKKILYNLDDIADAEILKTEVSNG